MTCSFMDPAFWAREQLDREEEERQRAALLGQGHKGEAKPSNGWGQTSGDDELPPGFSVIPGMRIRRRGVR